jgi:hypothetical protein
MKKLNTGSHQLYKPVSTLTVVLIFPAPQDFGFADTI